MSLAFRERPAAGEPEGALVLFHGRGADEHDLFPLLDALDPERRLHGYTPRGPLALPPGGAHWYVVPRVGFPDPETFASSYEPWPIAIGGSGDSRSSSNPGTVGTKPLSAISAAGRGRPRPSPTAYDMTAPCENPPRTSRSAPSPCSERNASSQPASRGRVALNVAGSG